ncbi:hypothetical protein [Microvirga sp. VF16]|uniref:hypothetical protein n=1 Tax=Microvirga sp. VF16 TaxID=2807101 RepID=UPI00193EB19C|nr:hypothetical protein [Microvirga sp. VF16]QRM32443.1 hypothetical protein JO965_30560 [Microvirga sp. VF16]
MNNKALLITVVAIVTTLFVSAFRVQAANESPLVTMERLKWNLVDQRHCEPILIVSGLATDPTKRPMTQFGASSCPA